MTQLSRLAVAAALVLGGSAPLSAQTGPGSVPTPASIRYSDLQGAEVRGVGGGRIAALEDVIVDAEGRIVEVLLGEGGLLGLGRKLHLVDAAALPGLGRAPIVAGMSAEEVAALPVYDADDPPDGLGPAPAAPAPKPRATAADGGTRPSAPAPSDNARASGTTSVEGETSIAGSGSGGMVPQQGTGSGATEVAPGASRPAEGGQAPTPEQARLNAEYGREKEPAPSAMPQDNAAAAATVRADGPGAGIADARGAGSGPPRTAAATARWRLGDLLGAAVRGRKDGLEIEDFRIADGRVVDVVLTESVDDRGGDLRAVDFSALAIAGDRRDPDVALEPSAPGRPIAE